MKKTTIVLGLVLASSIMFGQKKTKENMEVSNIQLPNYQLTETKTYNCTWTTNIEEDELAKWAKLGFNLKSIKGFLRLSGFDYENNGADINLNLISNQLILSEPEIINLESKGNPPNYRASYRFSGEWVLEVSGKHQLTFSLSDIIDNTSVKFPDVKNSDGSTRYISTAAEIEKALANHTETIEEIAEEELLNILFEKITEYINDELGYLTNTSTFKLYSFKTNKKFDMSAWDEPNLKAIELLNKINSGGNPSTIYKEYNDVFSFWDSEFDKNKSNIKENKNILQPTVKNLINTLLLVNPNAIKDEYITTLDEYIFLGDIEKRVIDAKAKQSANDVSNLNFKELIETPVLRHKYYPITYETVKGIEVRGMVEYSTPYYINPWETGSFVKIYDLDVYNKSNGKVVSKQSTDLKSINSYTIFGDKYVQMKFSDPRVVSIGGGANFLEEVIKGSASAYKTFSMEAAEVNGLVVDLSKGLSGQSYAQLESSRLNPAIVLDYGKKPIVICYYSKLAELLFDKKAIAMKIAEGKYGNTPLKIKDADSGKFSGGKDVSNDVILKIVDEFNTEEK